MASTTYRIERWRKTETGSDEWGTVKAGLTLEKAERLVEGAKWDTRFAFSVLRIVAEQPAETPASARKSRRPFDPIAQEQRVTRALTQMADYELREHDGSWIVTSPMGDDYLVSSTSCTCEDHLHLAGPAGGFCKHQVWAAHQLFLQGVILLPDTPGPSSPADLAQPVFVGNVTWVTA
jgi:hypothetical protein